MASTRRRTSRVAAAWLAALGFAGSAAAETAEPQGASATPQREERALEIAKRMAAVLSGADRIRMTVDVGYDAIQPDGEAIEFGATHTYALQRPDRVRIEAVDRDGGRRVVVYDGAQIAVADDSPNVYATAAHRDDYEGMLDYLQHDLSVPTPLAGLLSRDLFDHIDQADSADWVGEQTLDGVPCDHLAFRNSEKGLQLWVPKTGDPLPRRAVITYERERGRPQFRADLRDWDLSPRLADSLFVFSPAAGAQRIYFNTGARIVLGTSSEGSSQ